MGMMGQHVSFSQLMQAEQCPYSASGASDMSMYTYLYQDPEHLMGSTY